MLSTVEMVRIASENAGKRQGYRGNLTWEINDISRLAIMQRITQTFPFKLCCRYT